VCTGNIEVLNKYKGRKIQKIYLEYVLIECLYKPFFLLFVNLHLLLLLRFL